MAVYVMASGLRGSHLGEEWNHFAFASSLSATPLGDLRLSSILPFANGNYKTGFLI